MQQWTVRFQNLLLLLLLLLYYCCKRLCACAGNMKVCGKAQFFPVLLFVPLSPEQT